MGRRQTNIEFMSNLMDFARSGALMQAFVLEGLRIYAQEIMEADPEDLGNALISGHSWQLCAKEYLEKIEEHLK